MRLLLVASLAPIMLLLSSAVLGEEGLRWQLILDDEQRAIAVELHGLAEVAGQQEGDSEAGPFEVRVAGSAADTPAMAGSFSARSGRVRFTPRFRFEPGMKYVAVMRSAGDGQRVVHDFAIPRPQPQAAPVVSGIYPSADTLPENQLKFYLHFSVPMARGEAYDHVVLQDADGNAIELPFLEIGEELWDTNGTRLTLLIDPGRIKQGVKPREDIGPVLEAGKRYSLVVKPGWKSAGGESLEQQAQKHFAAGPPVAGALDPKAWKITAPAAGSREAVTLRFPAPLDHALLQRTLWIETGTREVEGTIETADDERVWRLIPKEPWRSGEYAIVVDTVLEDLAGNRIGASFEVDALDPLQKRVEVETVRLPFRPTAASR